MNDEPEPINIPISIRLPKIGVAEVARQVNERVRLEKAARTSDTIDRKMLLREPLTTTERVRYTLRQTKVSWKRSGA